MLTATARLSSTTGDGAVCASASYKAAIPAQSVCAAVAARAWQAAIAACSAYGPSTCTDDPASACARSSAARPRRISRWSQRVRSWSGSSTGRPAASTRAAMREACSSIRASKPCTSDSSGASPASMRPRRSASSVSAGRIQWSPVVAV